MNNVLNNIAGYTGTILYNSTIGWMQQGYQEGFWRGLHRIYSLTGFEKISKALIADIEFLEYFTQVGETFKSVNKALNHQKDLIYGTNFIDSIANCLRLQNGRIVFVRQTITRSLYAIGSFFEAGKLAQKYGMCKLEVFSGIANQLGSYEVFGYKPFTYRPFASFCERPKDFFILCACINDLGDHLLQFIKARTYDNRVRVLSVDNLLRTGGNIGKLLLIWCGSTQFQAPWYKVAALITQNISLVSFLLKEVKAAILKTLF